MRRDLLTGLCFALVAGLAVVPAGAQQAPQTGFEKRNGESWTTHEEELEFLEAVDERSARADVSVIGRTLEKRPLHLVRLGVPGPRSAAATRQIPTVLFVCSQHGNEPAGRETCLQLLRDLAFTEDAELVDQLEDMAILFVPAANPDGRDANTRENSQGIDVNRDHLNLETREAQAMARVVRDYKPDIVLDLHEYGPSVPVLYDDEVLYLWPRNLNVDGKVHDLAKDLAENYIATAAEENGYTADEYGLYEAGDQNVQQTAGDEDEGIARNAMGLRHSLGILIESRVDQDARNGPDEPTDPAAVNRRRVASQMVVSLETLRFMRERSAEVTSTTDRAPKLKAQEGRLRSEPVYWYGADNDPPEEGEYQDPPPCGYELAKKQRRALKKTFSLHGIKAGKRYVSLAQYAEPVVPLLLDERARRHALVAKPRMKCRIKPK